MSHEIEDLSDQKNRASRADQRSELPGLRQSFRRIESGVNRYAVNRTRGHGCEFRYRARARHARRGDDECARMWGQGCQHSGGVFIAHDSKDYWQRPALGFGEVFGQGSGSGRVVSRIEKYRAVGCNLY